MRIQRKVNMLLSACLLLLGLALVRAEDPIPTDQGIRIPLMTMEVEQDDPATKYLPLEKWLQQKDQNTCQADSRADILFAVDGSESVSLTDFHLVVKSILVDTISRLQIGENFIQVGVLVFSSQVHQVIPIGKFPTKVELLREVSRLTYDGSYTAIDAAIEGCIAELGRRVADAPNATDAALVAERKRLVVFLTDGRHTESFSLYVRDLLGQLYRRVTAVMALGLQNANIPTLQHLATDPSLVFDPTAYADYQTSLHELLNMRCSGTCYKYESQKGNVRKVVGTLVQYIDYLIRNYASYRKQQISLVDYSRSVNESVVGVEADIEATCNAGDNGLLKRIVTLQDRIRTETNGSKFAGASIDTYIAEMIRKINTVQREVFQQSQTLATEKTKLATTVLQEERLKTDFQSQLDSKVAVRKAQETSLAELLTRIESYRKELASTTESITRFENISVELSTRLSRQETVYTRRQIEVTTVTQEYTTLMAMQNGGDQQLLGMSNKLGLCMAHIRDGYTVLFAIRSGSGAAFQTLFSREETSFSEEAFTQMTVQKAVYKSPFLRNLHTMGYFSSVTWLFLDAKSAQLGSITMDTSRFELSSLFSQARVTTSFPWVASYVNSIYSSSLTQFRAKANAEFFLVFGDLARYRITGSCADIVGVFLVLTAPHRCFPEAAGSGFPMIYVSESPFGGRINRLVAELRLITGRLPSSNRPVPTRTTNDDQLTEVLLYAKAGAGFLHSLLLTSRYTPAALLADVDDLSQLARHYKSSMLANLNLENYKAIKLELFDTNGRVLVAMRFKGPFNKTLDSTRRQIAGSLEVGINADKWAWFQARYLDTAEPFDVRRVRAALFNFYDGIEFFGIGSNLAQPNCSERQYFLTVVDSATPCDCFGSALTTPAIFFSDDALSRPCDRLKSADSLRLTGELVGPLAPVPKTPELVTIVTRIPVNESSAIASAKADASATLVSNGPNGTLTTNANATAKAEASASGNGAQANANAKASASVDGNGNASAVAAATASASSGGGAGGSGGSPATTVAPTTIAATTVAPAGPTDLLR